MNARVDRCVRCSAPRDHPSASCSACGKAIAHVPEVYTHVVSAHGLSRREASLLADRARCFVRGWPAPPIAPELARLIGPRLESVSRVTTPADAAGNAPSAASVPSSESDCEIRTKVES